MSLRTLHLDSLPPGRKQIDQPSDGLLFLCSVSDVPPGSAIKVEVDDFVVAVINDDGTFFVIDDACTHGPGSLSEGHIEDGIVECDFHQGAFDIRTGAVVSPPCTRPVRTYAVVISDAAVYFDPHRPRSC
jgi:nitrite reductase/ring-hydroxylating ferredoxin subunit